jgi:hypothetical protein
VQDRTPELELDHEGRAWWRLDGRRWPVAAGADDGDDAAGNDDGDDAGDDDDAGDKAGKGDADKGGKGDLDEPEGDRKLRNEARNLRQRLRAAEAKLEQAAQEGMSEAEKAQAERDKAAAERDSAVGELRKVHLELAVAKAAKPLGILDETLAVRVMDADAVEYDDAGKPDPRSVTRALAAAVKAHPILVRNGSADGGEGGGKGEDRVGGFSAAIRQAAGKG